MEPKKKSKGDLEGRKNSFLLLGLVIVLSLVYASFELFATKSNENTARIENNFDQNIIDKTINTDTKTPPPPPPTRPNISTVIEIVDNLTPVNLSTIMFPEFGEGDEIFPYVAAEIIQPETSDPPIPFAEKMPEFPGGNDALQTYLKKEVKYPQDALKIGVSGTVLVAFVVEKDGRISNVKVLISSYPDLDDEAVRVISGFPKWNPGSQMGKPVRVSMQLPIRFTLN